MSDRRRRLEKLAELRDVREGNKKRSSQIKDSNDSPSIFAEEEDNPSDFIVDDGKRNIFLVYLSFSNN